MITSKLKQDYIMNNLNEPLVLKLYSPVMHTLNTLSGVLSRFRDDGYNMVGRYLDFVIDSNERLKSQVVVTGKIMSGALSPSWLVDRIIPITARISHKINNEKMHTYRFTVQQQLVKQQVVNGVFTGKVLNRELSGASCQFNFPDDAEPREILANLVALRAILNSNIRSVLLKTDEFVNFERVAMLPNDVGEKSVAFAHTDPNTGDPVLPDLATKSISIETLVSFDTNDNVIVF